MNIMHPPRSNGSERMPFFLRLADDERWKDADSRIRMALGLNVSDLLQEPFPFSEGEARLW
jgi:hypothetical protein